MPEVQQETGTAAAPESAASPESAATETAAAASTITELDGLSEFSYQGNKYTPEQLHKIMTEHKSYGEQVKNFSDDKKFYDNLDSDLEHVLNDPSLAQKFKTVYPPKFHSYVDKILRDKGQAAAPANTAQPGLPKEFLNKFGAMEQRLSFFEKRAFDAEVQSANAKLEALMPPLLTKFPLANEDQVYTRAEVLLQQGQKLTEKTWERLVRESHESMKKRSDQFYSAKAKQQLDKGKQGADMGAGGGSPGLSPRKPRTFAEAQEAMMASLNAR
jgi:hypothetical protein